MNALGIEASSADRAATLPAPAASLAEVVRNFPDTVFTAREAFSIACTNSPVMRLGRARLRASSAEVDYAIADLMPSVRASASLDWTNPLWAWNWGVNALQSVFQGYRKTTAVDRAVVAMQSSAAALDVAERDLSLALSLAVAERDNALLALATVRESLARARENLDVVSQQYRLGEASRIDFTDAVSDYVAELGGRITVFYRGQRAEAAIFPLMGISPEYREENIREEK
jgi:outer membrane protein TolC